MNSIFKKTEDYINNKIKELKFPYFSCIVKKNGKEVFNFNQSKFDNNLLCMYSMSKPITVVALLQLVEKGLVNLKDDVSKYLDGYDDLKLIETNNKITKKMTLHHLLTMTSGLDYDFDRASIKKLLKEKTNAGTVQIASAFAKDGLISKPGEKFNYSLSIDVCAAIVEKVSKMKFSDYVKKNIFNILKMNDSTFANNIMLSEKTIPDYLPTKMGLKKSEKYYKRFVINSKYESGGAGLISTVDDYSKFIDSLANRKNKILNDKTVDLMSKIYLNETPFNNDVQKYSKDSKEYGYGYGVRVRKINSKNGIPKGEFGWDGATGSYCLCDRKSNISIVMGLTIQNWPSYIKDFHIKLANQIYEDIKK